MKYVSLFSGIGGFDEAFRRAGMVCDSVCEIDKAAQAILTRHFPEAKLFDDVRKVGKETHERKSIDVICGGFPCQDVSVAGKRAGIAGERSGLWFEFARIIDELEPRWVVVENVPGLLSSNKGKDIQTIIDYLTQIGYTCDIDIKDAQEFGVPQRRRRVFITCVRLDGLLKQKTNLSKQISADLLSQILLNAWGATQQALSLVPLHLDYEKPIERCVSLLNKMIGLLDKTRERLACKKYQNNLDVLLDQFGDVDRNSEFGLIKKSEIQKDENLGKTVMYPFDLKVENGDMNISLWLKEYLDAVCERGKGRTISTLKNRITDHQIYIFSTMALLIVERILLSTDWSESYWSVASSLLTLIQENTNYARQASSNLFIESGLRDSWRDYLNSASNIQDELERRIGIIRAAEVLFESESGAGDNPPSREAGKDIAYSLRRNPSHSGDKGDGGINTTLIPSQSVAQSLTSSNTQNNGGGGITDRSTPTLIVMAHGQANAEIVNDGSPSLTTNHEAPILWEMSHASEEIRENGEVVPTLQARMGTGGNQVPMVGVRRLMPIECERLQGFPDGWTDGQSDSARYRQLGNAVAVPVVEWIAKRIVKAEARTIRKPLGGLLNVEVICTGKKLY